MRVLAALLLIWALGTPAPESDAGALAPAHASDKAIHEANGHLP